MWIDPYDVGKPPEGKSWQWVNRSELDKFVESAWLPVEASRVLNSGEYFEFYGVPVVALEGSVLVERDIELTNKAYEEVRAKAEQNIKDCLERMQQIVRDAYPDGWVDVMVLQTPRGQIEDQSDGNDTR